LPANTIPAGENRDNPCINQNRPSLNANSACTKLVALHPCIDEDDTDKAQEDQIKGVQIGYLKGDVRAERA